jgi:hypothetical protein
MHDVKQRPAIAEISDRSCDGPAQGIRFVLAVAAALQRTGPRFAIPPQISRRCRYGIASSSSGAHLREARKTHPRERTMKEPGLDARHRGKDGEISKKHGNTLVGTLRKIYGRGFAAGYPDASTLSEVMLQLNETSLSQLRRDHGTGHLEHKIGVALK